VTDVKAKVATLEEFIETRQAGYRTDIARPAEAMARCDTEVANRETRMPPAIAGMSAPAVAMLAFRTGRRSAPTPRPASSARPRAPGAGRRRPKHRRNRQPDGVTT